MSMEYKPQVLRVEFAHNRTVLRTDYGITPLLERHCKESIIKEEEVHFEDELVW